MIPSMKLGGFIQYLHWNTRLVINLLFQFILRHNAGLVPNLIYNFQTTVLSFSGFLDF